jgi:hypothetical protein
VAALITKHARSGLSEREAMIEGSTSRLQNPYMQSKRVTQHVNHITVESLPLLFPEEGLLHGEVYKRSTWVFLKLCRACHLICLVENSVWTREP